MVRCKGGRYTLSRSMRRRTGLNMLVKNNTKYYNGVYDIITYDLVWRIPFMSHSKDGPRPVL